MDNNKLKLKSYQTIIRSLASNIDKYEFIEIVFNEISKLYNVDGKSYYRIFQDNMLVIEMILNETMGMRLLSKDKTIPSDLKFPLYKNNKPNVDNISCMTANENKIINVDDVYSDTTFDFSGAKEFDKIKNYKTQSILSIPLNDYKREVVGVIQLINPRNNNGELICFNKKMVEEMSDFISQISSFLSISNLIQDLENLFDSMIRLVAQAIDEKSKYTGDHCQKVPEIAIMITENICKTDKGYFKDFNLSKEELREMEIASWLHDTGKIAISPNISDKSTKLERITNGLDIIRYKIEILKRDRTISFLENKIECINNNKINKIDSLEKQLNKDIKDLDLLFRSICKANEGGETLSDELKEKILEASKLKITIDKISQLFLDDYEKQALLIELGTLTESERKEMERHVTLTYQLLNELPFPKEYKNVPIIAGLHHEKLDGSGYPFGKNKDEIITQARILCFADIFEALIAKNRPYKKPYKLSKAIKMMHKLSADNKLDKEIFNAFLTEKIYLICAEKFMDKEYIDKININDFLFN